MPAFAVLDVETTGLAPRRDRVLEIAVVRVDASGAVVDEWATRLNPEGPVGATHIHGITDDDVAAAPLFRDVAPLVIERIGGVALAAHNARFDLAFLQAELTRAGWDVPALHGACTLDYSWQHLPDLDRRRLADCCAAAGVTLENAHSALGDARATAGLLRCYLEADRNTTGGDTLRSLTAVARSVTWPTSPSRAPAPLRPGASGGTDAARRTSPPRRQGPPLVHQLTALTLAEVLDEGAPEGSGSYLELLAEVLEDGVLTDAEATALREVVELYGLTSDHVAAAHRAFVTALAHRALDDGHVSRAERQELHDLASVLGLPREVVPRLIEHADAARAARLSAGLHPLPDSWSLGEPLRVGDKVAFTGSDGPLRDRLEKRAEELGVRVGSNVSRQTAMLVSDGSFIGTKAERARELGTRVVAPTDFDTLLRHLQPAARAAHAARPTTTTPTHSSASARARTSQEVSPAQIRAWARENGHTVNDRGRLPLDVVHAYHAAAGSRPDDDARRVP
ncbi:exonuclease domain-containing protein [Cellulosimicrobium arenosum]|uniref:Lsr2 family protein n=1 Tax=Cellulosimicrobium arenosum TaxID=2708133 RepID=A0A927G7J0_9MICO|nr:histone-like nucleoid-structuring protein Lsr2 [Cellulosimicrobium arenosum]MBD8078168.1 Lsr2 family protein [Cellulosimicrobium arenosum]